MKLAVFSHKPCWRLPDGRGYATDGGFPLQMRALSEVFAETRLVVPVSASGPGTGALELSGRQLSVVPLSPLRGEGLRRKLLVLPWLLRNGAVILRETLRADAVHAPIPGDVGTLGMLTAFVLRKPLFVRHCGNWFAPRTAAEHFWRWFMERFAGGRNVMMATGGHPLPPSERNAHVKWVFSTSMSQRELRERGRSLDGASPRLITVSRQEEAKGTGRVIAALPLLVKRYPALMLDVVGDGSALGSFKQLAERLGVAGNVVFHGKVGHERVLELLDRSTVFCYPTAASEGFPKVVLEALAMGLPVISTHVSVIPHLLQGGAGIVVDEVSPEALGDAVRQCLDDPERYRAMSEQGISTARAYSLERWQETLSGELCAAWGTRLDG